MLGGLILALASIGGVSTAGMFGQALGITMSIIWLAVGIIFGMLFLAVANGLFYLRTTMENTVRTASSTAHASNASVSSSQRTLTPDKVGSRDTSLEWKCPKCGVENPGILLSARDATTP